MRRMTPRRGGFTLIELLVVIGILATLAALATAAFLVTRKNEQVRASETTIQKLNLGLDARWKAVLDDARDDLTKGRLDALVQWAGNDKDRALAIWSYLKLKNEFPTTIQEAANPVVLTDPYNGQVVVTLPAKAVFRSVLKDAGGNPLPTGVLVNFPRPPSTARLADESALFFYWGLTQTSIRGMTFGQEGTGNQTGEIESPIPFVFGNNQNSSLTGKAFKDAYGKPIAFVRLAYSPEINAAPYAKSSAAVAVGSVKVVPNDPLDPQGKLPTAVPAWTGGGQQPPWDQGKLNAFWKAATDGHLGYQWSLGGATLFPGGVPKTGYPFDVTSAGGVTTLTPFNVVPTLIAAGEDKTFDSGIGGGDDLMGFRLRREGNRGN